MYNGIASDHSYESPLSNHLPSLSHNHNISFPFSPFSYPIFQMFFLTCSFLTNFPLSPSHIPHLSLPPTPAHPSHSSFVTPPHIQPYLLSHPTSLFYSLSPHSLILHQTPLLPTLLHLPSLTPLTTPTIFLSFTWLPHFPSHPLLPTSLPPLLVPQKPWERGWYPLPPISLFPHPTFLNKQIITNYYQITNN